MRSLVFNHLGSGYVRTARKAIDEGAIGDLVALHIDFHFAKGDPDLEAGAGPAELSAAWSVDLSQRRPVERSFRLWTQRRGQARAVRARRVSGGDRPLPGRARGGAEFRRRPATISSKRMPSTARRISLPWRSPWTTASPQYRWAALVATAIRSRGAQTIHAVGTAGTLIVDASRQAMTVCSSDGGSPRTESVAMHEVAGTEAITDHFVRVLDGEEEPWADVAEGRKHVEVLLAGYRSIATGQPVDLRSRGISACPRASRAQLRRNEAWQPHRRSGAVHPSDPE